MTVICTTDRHFNFKAQNGSFKCLKATCPEHKVI